MDSHKDDARDAEGLQAIEQENFPEVVPGQQLPSRKNSVTSPEAVSTVKSQHFARAPSQQWSHQERVSYTPIPSNEYQEQTFASSSPPQYSDYGAEKQQPKVEQNTSEERKIMGMRRKVFIWVAVVVIFLIVVAAVLGGVLGSVLSNNDDKSSNANTTTSDQFQLADKSGLALLDGSDGIYAYYMDEAGSIVETAFGSDWSQNNTALPSTTNVTTGASPNSPIAAVTYSLQGGTNYRQIFYFDNEGVVMTVNTTGGGTWAEAYAPISSGQSSMQGTVGLTAVAATGEADGLHLNGIRVYFGSSNNYIQEIGCDFTSGTPEWHVWAAFDGSDASSGVSTVVINEVNHLYFRNSTTGRLQQWMWDYTVPGPWTLSASSSADDGVAQGGSIAAATDGSDTDYIFYQMAGSSTVVASYSGSGSSISSPMTSVDSIQSAPVGYALAATYMDQQGAVVLNQNSSSSSELLFASVSRNGQSQVYSTETGTGS